MVELPVLLPASALLPLMLLVKVAGMPTVVVEVEVVVAVVALLLLLPTAVMGRVVVVVLAVVVVVVLATVVVVVVLVAVVVVLVVVVLAAVVLEATMPKAGLHTLATLSNVAAGQATDASTGSATHLCIHHGR